MVRGPCHFDYPLMENLITRTRVDNTTCQTKEKKLQEWINRRFQCIKLVSRSAPGKQRKAVHIVLSMPEHSWHEETRNLFWCRLGRNAKLRYFKRDLVFLGWEIRDNFYDWSLLLIFKTQSLLSLLKVYGTKFVFFITFWIFKQQNVYFQSQHEIWIHITIVQFTHNISFTYMSGLGDTHKHNSVTFFNGSNACFPDLWRFKSRWQFSHIIQIRKNKAIILLGLRQEPTVF